MIGIGSTVSQFEIKSKKIEVFLFIGLVHLLLLAACSPFWAVPFYSFSAECWRREKLFYPNNIELTVYKLRLTSNVTAFLFSENNVSASSFDDTSRPLTYCKEVFVVVVVGWMCRNWLGIWSKYGSDWVVQRQRHERKNVWALHEMEEKRGMEDKS